MPDNPIKCCECNNIIPLKHLADDSASNVLDTPDSAYTSEQYISVCCHCESLSRGKELAELRERMAELEARITRQAITIEAHQSACREAGLDPCDGVANCIADHAALLAAKDEEIVKLTEALRGFYDGECHCDTSIGKCVQCVAGQALKESPHA